MRRTGIFKAGVLLGLYVATSLLAGCIVAAGPQDGYYGQREGYYDHDHARWYHNHAWVACRRGDEHCR